MADIKDRLKLIMEQEGLNAGAFAESIGVAQATISHILGPRNKYPSTEVILRLHQRYPNISLDWLMTGNGSMTTDGMQVADAAAPTPMLFNFGENQEFRTEGNDVQKNRRDLPLETAQNGIEPVDRQEIIYKEKPPRKITEIRIFFDDSTYETFTPKGL